MSLLEDVFLQDEANEAQELERVIEGDEYDERPLSLSPSNYESDGGNREDEAEEDKRRVDPTSTKTKKITKNPRFVLNPARLTGPRGIQVIPEHFKDFKFKGKGHEKEDLDMVLKKLEHWAYRLYPKFEFQDCLKKIETLGRKRPVMVHLHKIRTDQFMSEETVVQKDSSDDEAQPPQEEDEFDKLLRQQIELARATPAPDSTRKAAQKHDQWERIMGTPVHDDRPSLLMPKATSSPSISDEQKERMLRNRKLAEERRLARLKQTTSNNNIAVSNTIIEIDEQEPVSTNITDTSNIINTSDQEDKINKKSNRSNVFDSSDSDEDVSTVHQSIIVDVHQNRNVDTNKNGDKLVHDDKTSHNEEEEMIVVDQRTRKSDRDEEVDVPVNITRISHKQNTNHVIEIENNDTINSDDGDKGAKLTNSDDDYVKESDTIVIVDMGDNQTKDTKYSLEDKVYQDNTSVSNDDIQKQSIENDDYENTKQKDVTDVMDVDFSDDF